MFAALAVLAIPGAALAQSNNQYEAAVEARLAGRPAEAASLLRAWLARNPGDVDAQLHLAYAELALGNLEAAEAGFRAILTVAPNYADAREGLTQIQTRRGVEDAALRPELYVEGSLSDLEGRADRWYEVGARLRLPRGRTTTLEGGGTYFRRFGQSDLELSGSLVKRAGEDLWLRVAVSATPQADFRPRWGVGGGFDWRLRGGDAATVVTIDARYESFPAQHVTTILPGIVQYLAGGRIWITVRAFGVIPEDDDLKLGWMLRGDFAPAEHYRFYAGVTDGPDTDLGVVTQVTTLFGGVELPLGERVGLIAGAGHEWRQAGADRIDFRLGVKVGL